MENKKQECIAWLKDSFIGFEDYQYEMASEVGNVDLWNNSEPSLINVDFRPYISRIGKRYSEIFEERVRLYFDLQIQKRELLNLIKRND